MTSLWSRNPCAAAGAISGGFAGLMIALAQTMHGIAPVVPPGQFWRTILLLTLAGWLAVLFVIGVMLRYGIGAIAMPSLVTCFITVALTVWFVDRIDLPQAGAVVGILIGTIIGLLLCFLFCRREALLGDIRG